MSREVSLSISYPPATGNTAVRHTKTGGHYQNPKIVAWRNENRARINLQNIGALVGMVRVSIIAIAPDKKARDADNVVKVTNDLLTYCDVLQDDSNQVIRELSFVWCDPDKQYPQGWLFVDVKEI